MLDAVVPPTECARPLLPWISVRSLRMRCTRSAVAVSFGPVLGTTRTDGRLPLRRQRGGGGDVWQFLQGRGEAGPDCGACDVVRDDQQRTVVSRRPKLFGGQVVALRAVSDFGLDAPLAGPSSIRVAGSARTSSTPTPTTMRITR